MGGFDGRRAGAGSRGLVAQFPAPLRGRTPHPPQGARGTARPATTRPHPPDNPAHRALRRPKK
ncbi:hypothetical protein DMH25_43560 [Streptomyces sp. WAC 01325]|nr:hypothetical protein DMH25_43560 [Streptomyces sp. WAC 01325]